MNLLFYFLTLLILGVLLVVSNPGAALEWVISVRRQFRQSVKERAGNQIAQELATQLRAEAKDMGIPETVADEVIAEHKQEILDRLGGQYARNLFDD